MKHCTSRFSTFRPKSSFLGGAGDAAILFGAVLLWFLQFGCGSQTDDTVAIEEVRTIADATPDADATGENANRFGYAQSAPAAPTPSMSPPTSSPLEYPSIKGWREVAPTQFRNPNFIVGDDENTECYVTITPSGGLLPNVNRWRGQMGLEPLANENEIESVATLHILGLEAPLIDIKGTYTTRDAAPKVNYRMLASIIDIGGAWISIKMVGPEATVAANVEEFKTFCEGLSIVNPTREASSAGPLPPGARELPPDHPPITGSAAPAFSDAPVAYETPAGWTPVPPSGFRPINFKAGPKGEIECYVSIAGGGANANIVRWYGQMGHTAPSEDDIDNFPDIEILGTTGPLVELTGTFQGMRGPAQEGYAMLGTFAPLGEQSLFVKMIGPAELVAAEKQRFVSFCKSINLK